MAKKIKTDRYNITFTEWCRKYKVSTKWDENNPKNQQFIERLINAREALGIPIV
jgi:hypothetical protein